MEPQRPVRPNFEVAKAHWPSASDGGYFFWSAWRESATSQRRQHYRGVAPALLDRSCSLAVGRAQSRALGRYD